MAVGLIIMKDLNSLSKEELIKLVALLLIPELMHQTIQS